MKRTVEPKERELPRFLNFKEVRRLTGLSRATIWRMERLGQFPARRRVTTSKVSWLQSEILSWMEGRERIEPVEQLEATKLQESVEPTPVRRPTSWIDRDDE